ncbi:MAG: peptidoglycan DD-metalloendopeptidase family protein [Coriobacteriia bacterium]|nr:peptidoglycan DD-metalloendopeptidase family protein [Coriobacteriia bacterium]
MKRSRAYFIALLALAMALSSVAPALGATSADLAASRQKAAEARKAAETAQATADQLKVEVQALDSKIASLEGKVKELEPKISQATSRTAKLKAEVEQLRARITQKQTEIVRVEADYDVQQQLLGARMSTSYKQGNMFYVDLLLGSKNFSDLISRTTLVQRVIESDQDIAAHLKSTKFDLENRKAGLGRALDEVQVKRTEAELVEKNLKSMRSQRQSAVDQQEGIQDQKAAMMVDNAANAARLRKLAEAEEAEARDIEKELAARSSGGAGQYNGVMAWPVPGFYRVTSPYGPRICPFHGAEVHPGIDVGRNVDPEQSINGAAIVAAGDGTVIYAGYRGSYGNTVMIDHGDGLVTLYAHQQGGGITVSVGAHVSKGERIGTVGSTGNSTGPHLHFETRVNGRAINPMVYVR